jgi:hypothetical protein
MLPLIFENADFRPPTHVSSGRQLTWLVAGSDSGPEAQISGSHSRSPDFRFGRESGRESPIPDSAGIGNRGIPVSRFGRDRESGPDGGGPGIISWSESEAPPACQCLPVMLVNRDELGRSICPGRRFRPTGDVPRSRARAPFAPPWYLQVAEGPGALECSVV